MGPINRKYLTFFLILITLGSLLLVACGSSGKRETEPAERPVPETTESSVETALPAEPPVTHESIEEDIVVERDGVLIRVKSLDFSNPGGPALIYEIENKQDEERVILVDEMKVNGLEVFNGFQSFPGEGKREYACLFLDRQAYQEHKFESIEELSVRFQIRSGDYTKGPLYSTEPFLFTFEKDSSSP